MASQVDYVCEYVRCKLSVLDMLQRIEDELAFGGLACTQVI